MLLAASCKEASSRETCTVDEAATNVVEGVDGVGEGTVAEVVVDGPDSPGTTQNKYSIKIMNIKSNYNVLLD